jgi:hypothetical protein
MRRQLVPTCLLLGAALLAPALIAFAHSSERAALAATALRPAPVRPANVRPASERPASERPLRHWLEPISDDRACKPQPPVATTLVQLAADGDVVVLSFSVTPHADAGAVRWSLALPPGAVLLEGPASGTLAAGSDGTGALAARLRLPPGEAQVALDVEGTLAISAGPTAAGGHEPLRARRALTWLLPQPAAALHGATNGEPSVGQRLADSGSRTPVRHREGR